MLAVDIFDDAFCIFLRNFEIADSGQQVDMSYFHVSTYVLIQKLHQLARIETILLA